MNHMSAEELKRLRLKLKISMERLAVNTGVSSYEIGQFERGKGDLSPEQHRAISLFVTNLLLGCLYQ